MCTDKLSQKGRCLLNVQTHSRKHETEEKLREELTERRVRLTERMRMCDISSWVKEVGPHGINFPHKKTNNKTNKHKKIKIKQN